MKVFPGIDEDGNPKDGPFKLFFRNGLVSCLGEFDNVNRRHRVAGADAAAGVNLW